MVCNPKFEYNLEVNFYFFVVKCAYRSLSEVYERQYRLKKDDIDLINEEPLLILDELIKIDIKTLRSFMAIVECQGVTAGQSRLNVTTSVISGHLTHLEDRLGMTLCHRGRAGFKLTEDGAAVYEACLGFTESVASFQHQLHYIKQLDSVHGGHIRLCLIDQMPKFFYDALRQRLANSYRNNPLIHFSIDVQ
ncbi:hypothetical protein LCGC14_2867130, partial [marine sediment metagenome]